MRIGIIFFTLMLITNSNITYANGDTSDESKINLIESEVYSAEPLKEQTKPCIKKEEISALKIRVMRDRMSVSSRNCTETESNLYLKIEDKFKYAFSANNTILEIFFQRIEPNDSEKKMHKFITNIANSASINNTYNKEKFCSDQSELMKEMIKINPKDIAGFAEDNIKIKISNPKLCK